VSDRSLPVAAKWRLLRIAPVLGIAIAVAVLIPLFHVPHGQVYYGALAGLYIIFLGPRFQLWVLRRQDRD
jgi:membrane protein YdbS with pleckstrin-like domain